MQNTMEYVDILYKAMSKESSFGADEEVLRLALILLRDLPPSMETVLEYLSMLLRHFADDYFQRLQIKDVLVGGKDSRMVADVECNLLHLINNDPSLWSFMLAKWSIVVIGRLSTEVGAYGNAPAFNSPTTWSNCLSTQCLCLLLNKCLHNLSLEQLYSCFDKLLATSIKNTSCFDWLLSQISSSFPEEIVWRMLQCGLQDFHLNNNKPPPPSSNQPSSNKMSRQDEEKVVRVTGVLTHLTHYNHQLIYKLLLKFLQACLAEEAKTELTALFLLQLASKSTSLLNIICQIFFDFVSPRELKRIVRLVQRRSKATARQVQETLVGVLLTYSQQPLQLLETLVALCVSDYSAYPAGDLNDETLSEGENRRMDADVASFCCTLMNLLSTKLQKTSSLPPNQLNLINSLNTNLPALSHLFRPPFARKTLVYKLLTSFSSFFPSSSSQLLALIFSRSANTTDLAIFRELERVISFKQPRILNDTLGRLVAMVESADVVIKFKLVSLIHQMCLHESNSAFNQHSLGNDFCKALGQYHVRLIKLLHFPPQEDPTKGESKENAERHGKTTVEVDELRMVHDYNGVLLELLKLIQAKNEHRVVDHAEVLECSCIFINLLFTSLTHLRDGRKLMICKELTRQLTRLCQLGGSTRQHAIRTLLAEAFTEKHCGLFQSASSLSHHARSMKKTALKGIVPSFERSLHAQNMQSCEDESKQFGLLFHSGTIGAGLKPDHAVVGAHSFKDLSEDEILMNEFLLLHTLQSCCFEATNNTACPTTTSAATLTAENSTNLTTASNIASITNPSYITSSHTIPSQTTPPHTTPSHTTLSQTTSSHTTPSHNTPSHITPSHTTLTQEGPLSKEVVRVLSSCLIEHCTPDALCNTAYWGDEEFIKLTYARCSGVVSRCGVVSHNDVVLLVTEGDYYL